MSSVDIIVVRGSGDRPGEDIVSGLLSDLDIAMMRGASDISDSTPIYDVSLEVGFKPGILNGQYVMVLDEFQGSAWYGKIVSVTHVIEHPSYYTTLRVERAA